MRILVISDTHKMIRIAQKVINYVQKSIDLVIHLGDCEEDADFLQAMFPNLKIESVSGNCDYCSERESEKIFIFNSIRVFVTHGHRYNVKMSLDRLSYAAEEKDARVVLYGHTHIPRVCTMGSAMLVNPGSISQPRTMIQPTYAILNITDSGIASASIVAVYSEEDYRVLDL